MPVNVSMFDINVENVDKNHDLENGEPNHNAESIEKEG